MTESAPQQLTPRLRLDLLSPAVRIEFVVKSLRSVSPPCRYNGRNHKPTPISVDAGFTTLL